MQCLIDCRVTGDTLPHHPLQSLGWLEPAGVWAIRGQNEENPLPIRESGVNQGKLTDWRRWESNPHLRIANAPHNSPKLLINKPETHDAETVLARRWALLAQKDARLAELIDGWAGLSHAMREAIAAIVLASGEKGAK